VNVSRFSDARAFLDRAEDWLLRKEAENNLILAIANHLLRGDHPYEDPIYLATIEIHARVSGCAWRTPPFKLGLTQIPIASIPSLVHDVAEVYTTLPAIVGPAAEATEFAKLWARQFGTQWAVGLRQRIFLLERVIAPTAPVHGRLRKAQRSDLVLIAEWGADFARDTSTPIGDTLSSLERLIRDGSLYLWDDGEPRSMAAAVGTTPNGIRVGYVYTPPSFRGFGYATASVASLSQSLLNDGKRFCFLYTDLANPISNAIYQRIGYQPVSDVVDVDFC
jgi:hypothetical protein